MLHKSAVIAIALWAAPSYADSAAENLLNGLLDLSRYALLDGENIEQRIPDFIESSEVTEVSGTETWPVSIDDPFGMTFAFQVEIHERDDLYILTFRCSRLSEVTHAYLAKAGFLGKDEFGLPRLPNDWLQVAGAHKLPETWPNDVQAEVSCAGGSFSEDGVPPLSTDGLQAFFEEFINEEDISRRSWPAMMVTSEAYLFELRSDVEHPSHRTTKLRVLFTDSFFTLIEIRGDLLTGSS